MFKSDSQRVAFLLCVAFSVLGGMQQHRYCVAHIYGLPLFCKSVA
ncbi:DUF3265 domain-containing protein [Vibrio parahaemolyticus]|nr:DUF3265 domain-containing protein [Vibrio parahaemolyticus]